MEVSTPSMPSALWPDVDEERIHRPLCSHCPHHGRLVIMEDSWRECQTDIGWQRHDQDMSLRSVSIQRDRALALRGIALVKAHASQHPDELRYLWKRRRGLLRNRLRPEGLNERPGILIGTKGMGQRKRRLTDVRRSAITGDTGIGPAATADEDQPMRLPRRRPRHRFWRGA